MMSISSWPQCVKYDLYADSHHIQYIHVAYHHVWVSMRNIMVLVLPLCLVCMLSTRAILTCSCWAKFSISVMLFTQHPSVIRQKYQNLSLAEVWSAYIGLWCSTKQGCTININPLHAKFFRGNKNIYLHFMSHLHIDMIHDTGSWNISSSKVRS